MPRGKGRGSVPFILEYLDKTYVSARVVLHYRTPFELLVATVLAAQCTDDRVNRVTRELFVRYPDPSAFATASLPEIEEAVRPTGFYRNKARALREIASSLMTRHRGTVPKSMEELTALPGVGRKTASVLLGACFGVDALPVDTHVARVSFRLGLTSAKDPVRIEEDLVACIPGGRRWNFATRLGWHGRQVCIARQPRCGACGLFRICPRNGVTRSS